MTGRGIGSLVAMIVAGVLLGALCVLGALLVMGMGHGWGQPLRLAPWSLLFYPAAMALLWGAARRRAGWTCAVPALALLLLGLLLDGDAWSRFHGTTDGAHYARLDPGTVMPWLALWLGWQLVAVLALLRPFLPDARRA